MEKLKCLYDVIRFLWSRKQTSFIRAINKNGIRYIIDIYEYQTVKEFVEKLEKECT